MSDDMRFRITLNAGDVEGTLTRLENAMARLGRASGDADGRLAKVSQSLNRIRGAQAATTQTMDQANKAWDKQNKLYDDYLNHQNKATSAQQNLHQSLNQTRFALYDVAYTLGIAGAAMVGLAAATYGAGIAWERDFANVIRTSRLDPASEAVNTLRENFQDLAETIPVSASELSKIGTLGGQLGISANQLTAFTSVVARFSATTNLSVDDAATAFGRLNALIPDIDGNFEALGSSILKVGTNSVATESEITKVAVQISAMGTVAGLSAADIIGLAGALASVGIQPELARGTVTRLFTLISQAVSGTTDKLDEFARVSGVSADQFRQAWGTSDFGDVLLGFLDGIQKEGTNSISVLRDLGITSVRDVPALLRLANAADAAGQSGELMNQTFRDARTGFEQAAEVQRQFAIIQDTVASKLQITANSFQNLMTEISDGGTVIGGAVDILNQIIQSLTDIARSPVGGTIVQITVGAMAFIGALSLLGAAAAVTTGGIIALQVALVGLKTSGITFGLANLLTQMTDLGVISTRTATLVNGVGFAVKGLAVLGIAAAITFIANEFFRMGAEASGATAKIEELQQRLIGAGNGFSILSDELGRNGSIWARFENIDIDKIRAVIDMISGKDDSGKGLPDKNAVAAVTENLKKIDESFATLVSSGNIEDAGRRVIEFRKAFRLNDIELRQAIPGYFHQIDLAAEAAGVSTTEFLYQQTELVNQQDALAGRLGISVEELGSLENAVRNGANAMFDLGSIIGAVTKDGVFNLEDFNTALSAQVTALENWRTNILTLAAQGVDQRVINELISQGPEVAGQLVQAIVGDLEGQGASTIALLTAGQNAANNFSEGFLTDIADIKVATREATREAGVEAGTALRDALISGSYDNVVAVIAQYNLDLENNPLLIQADTDPAANEIETFIRLQPRRSIPIYVDLVPGSSVTIPGGGGAGMRALPYASGGPIHGPGSGTSDSILARLSNGEFVMKASSVSRYGTAFMDAINRGVFPKFAGGGSVGGSGGGMDFPAAMNLGPVERSLLRKMGSTAPQINVMLDDIAIARAANRGNKVLGTQGTR